ncbi:Gfo/Idh/MocA family protein [Allosalinactinospora lopnorensis]|uniref:Gfo/Idh/MocA family protein n=1 Tax=Allosalinactinospora lopnorensis TaxID=1352348 RepID=UPI000A7BC43D
MAVPVVVAGVNGHGRSHLAELRRLGEQGRARLVGICDLVPPDQELSTGLGAVEYDRDLGALLKRTGAEVTLVATPIHTHLPLARTALEHGSHLFLEKPPTASLAEFEELRAALRAHGAACQVGFQSLGSSAVPAARELIAEGTIGDVRGISGKGRWVRTTAYYKRSVWAGRRRMDGHDVVDGALTNPFAHMVATALALAGAGELPPPISRSSCSAPTRSRATTPRACACAPRRVSRSASRPRCARPRTRPRS